MGRIATRHQHSSPDFLAGALGGYTIMTDIVNYPLLVFTVAFVSCWLSAHLGAFFRVRLRPLEEDERENFDVIQAAALTLLGLLVGFTFSMATGRYEQRKNYEEAEANAIGTEYVRADLLPAADAQKVRALLANYTNQRILFYRTRNEQLLSRVNADTAQLQTELWATVAKVAGTQQTPIIALAVSGMNDVLNSQGYTQAAWWNRIPPSAWGLMLTIGVCCNLLIGYCIRRTGMEFIVFL